MKVEINFPEHVILIADDEKVSLERKGLVNFINNGNPGTTVIPYRSIASIDYKRPGLSRGHLVIIPASGEERRGGIGALDFISVWGKKNAVIFGRAYASQMDELKSFLDKKIDETRRPATTISQADELAKFKALLDDGVITKDEFEAKKQQLING